MESGCQIMIDKSKKGTQFFANIGYINVILSILIVALHSDFSDKYSTDVPYYWLYTYAHNMVSVIADCAVPIFFVMSAFLFYRNFSMQIYPSKLKSRFKTVAVPYFIWSATGIIYQLAISFVITKDVSDFLNLREVLISWLMCEHNAPLWFLRTLFCFVIISPVIYNILKLSKYSIIISGLIFVANLLFEFDYTSVAFWFPIYFLGAWCGIYAKDFIEHLLWVPTSQSEKRKMLAGTVCVILLVLVVGFIGRDNRNIYYIYRMLIGCSVVFILMQIPFNTEPKSYLQNSFFIFCTHALCLGLSTQVCAKVFGLNGFTMILGYIASIVITLLITIVAAETLKRFLSNVYVILAGGRGR